MPLKWAKQSSFQSSIIKKINESSQWITEFFKGAAVKPNFKSQRTSTWIGKWKNFTRENQESFEGADWTQQRDFK